MNRALAASAVVLVLIAALTGCPKPPQETPTTPSAPEKPPSGGVIGLSVLTMTNPFFKEIADAMADEAARSGYEVIVTSSEEDPAKQFSQVQDFIVKKVDAIVLTPANSKSVGTAIQEANKAGIPVFTADIASLAEEGEVVSHIATDNYSGGREAAKAIMEALDNQGKVGIIDHPEVESVILRTKGFRDELKESGSPIEIVGAWPGKGSKDEAFKVAQDILTAHKDLNGIFAINDPSALGACAAIEKAGLTGKVVVVGFDGQLEGKRAILDGKIFADPIQFPDQIGRQTVQTILKYLGGEQVEPEILIPTQLYYKADAEKDPALKSP
ncbi:MAG: substrate-binding domain-containing protein [Armatimonadetes bacterium]|nr:substrate-binding domain-containing protein [Armatimonadota bacterium]